MSRLRRGRRRARTGEFLPTGLTRGREKPHKRQGRLWQAYKTEQLARAGWRCEKCGVTDQPLEVHHLWPISRGGPVYPDDPDCPDTGIRVLCKWHHLRERQPAHIKEWYDLLDELAEEGYG